MAGLDPALGVERKRKGGDQDESEVGVSNKVNGIISRDGDTRKEADMPGGGSSVWGMS